jgi:ribosomal protein S15P/S13E
MLKKTSERTKKIRKKTAGNSSEKAESEKIQKLSQEDFEKKVLELGVNGLTSEKIGEALRKQGIHPKEFGKKISTVLGKNYSSPDEKNIREKFEKIKKHFGTNKGDKRAMREKERVFAQLNRLKAYLAR